ncbi:hypothetical protein [Myxococcus stipitatus]|nr:hypothetical protein [Myxococcus stipitatus]
MAGVLTVRAAVHTPEGSSQNFMRWLALACVGLMMDGEWDDAALSAFFTGVFRP